MTGINDPGPGWRNRFLPAPPSPGGTRSRVLTLARRALIRSDNLPFRLQTISLLFDTLPPSRRACILFL